MNNVYTIGHSTRTTDEFIELLQAQKITRLIDIRTIPKSRHNPQFGQEILQKNLEDSGIHNTYIAELGGLRPKINKSANDGWRNASFRNYANYMQTDEFQKGLKTLIAYSKNEITAIMCAEAVPWQCHRSLVSDALFIRDILVCEIIGAKSVRKHSLTSFAVVNRTHITYPLVDLL